MGTVCAKHEQFYETECRYCEPAEIKVPSAAAAPPIQPRDPRLCACGDVLFIGGPPYWDIGDMRHTPTMCDAKALP